MAEVDYSKLTDREIDTLVAERVMGWNVIKGVYVELGPTQSVMAVINEDGDKKTIWDRHNPVEVEVARHEFGMFREKGYMAYKVEGKEGRRGEVLHAFDPEAERIIFAPPLRGGN